MRLAVILASTLLVAASAPAARAPASIDSVAFMAGDWGTTDEKGWTHEHWSAPMGGTMMGYSMSGSDSVTFHEFMRIAPDDDGQLALVVTGVDLTPVAFALTQSAPNSATFEAPDHDYPQKIKYMRDGDVMVATISMTAGSHVSTWEYRRK
ncbi:DUF6265 family protein [Sphingosinithalassobacter portus]|uniref:DUF6265 family protein n=1 Tax=Stakelama portus TaxID=2676234 RepID=UPI000D6E5F47|nr:DUF6265 family protein [Sphingosinithalassobacter portus]